MGVDDRAAIRRPYADALRFRLEDTARRARCSFNRNGWSQPER